MKYPSSLRLYGGFRKFTLSLNQIVNIVTGEPAVSSVVVVGPTEDASSENTETGTKPDMQETGGAGNTPPPHKFYSKLNF